MQIQLMIVWILLVTAWRVEAVDIQKSTIENQSSVEVTVYNSNLAFIKDVRKLNLPKGSGELRFMDVAAYIMPETVHVKSLNVSDQFSVLEQNYEYDLMDRNKLLDKYVGKEIKLLDRNFYTDRKEMVKANLLSNNAGQQIYQIDGEIYLGHSGQPILPSIPDNLIAQPTLMWLYDNKSKVDKVEVSYLTSNMGWKADYVLILNKDDTKGDLSGWVTIDNNSGTMYKDASLKLIAGEVNRAMEGRTRAVGGFQEAGYDLAAKAAPAFVEQSFFEYHIYDLQRKTTLKNNQTKQINLLEANGFAIQKEFLVYGINTAYTYQYREEKAKQSVNVNVKFKNAKDNKLGIPLPKGIMRLYKQDEKGNQQFIGEDRMEHTPKDEEVSLKVGEAFDITAERRQVDFRITGSNVYESEWEIVLKNHKESDIVVGIVEPIPFGSWQVISNSHPFQKKDAFTLRFDVPVKKDQEAKLTYRVRIRN